MNDPFLTQGPLKGARVELPHALNRTGGVLNSGLTLP